MRARRLRYGLLLPFVSLSIAAAWLLPATGHAATALTEKPGQLGTVKPAAVGGLDCNGLSPTQRPVKRFLACTDLRNPNSDDGRFTDNGVYIGHDEPALNFSSTKTGSANNVVWAFTIGKDPGAAPTGIRPGHDVSHYFELTPALWFSMPMCDPQSYPILPCTPKSDDNAPSGRYPGGGSAFMELQFYPPGFGPWAVGPSFDNKHWGAALTIDSLEGTAGFTNLNPNCEEPVNFSFIQTNGVPPGPPSPQLSDLASDTPNAHTLLMNPGDRIRVHIYDAPVPDGSGDALKTVVEDVTTGQSGYIQASAANGFMNTSIVDCSGTPFNFEPEYNTAAPGHLTPWGAGTELISASFETGHWEPCTSLSDKAELDIGGTIDPFWETCHGPYEDAAPGGDGGSSPETSDAPCYPKGDTHNGLATGNPDTMTGCLDEFFQNGDLDFDGTPYWREWPTSTLRTTTPASFKISPPTTGSSSSPYPKFQFQTDLGFTEVTTCDPGTPNGCVVPPPNAPGNFYPFWTLAGSGASCDWEFGRVLSGKTFSGDKQYGTVSTDPALFPEIASRFYTNTCSN